MDIHYFHLASQITVTAAPPNSTLVSVIVNKGAAGATVTVFDGNNPTSTTASSTVATIDAGNPGNFFYGCVLRAGITATMASGSADVTINYQLPDEGGDIEYAYGKTYSSGDSLAS